MTNTEIRTSHVKIPNKDLQIDAYLAEPKNEGVFPSVIVIQEIFGVNSHIRDVTERIAKEGYVAIAPAIYQRLAPGFETGYTPEDIEIGRKYKDQTKADELLSDIQSTIAYLKNLPNVKGDAIGSIGFCFGGHVVYLASILPDIKATASFYGAGITTSIRRRCNLNMINCVDPHLHSPNPVLKYFSHADAFFDSIAESLIKCYDLCIGATNL